MPCQICNSTTHCQCFTKTDIYEKIEKFVEDTVYNANVSNHSLLNHLLQYIATLTLHELYLLAKHIPEYRQPKNIFSDEAKAGYIHLIYTTYMREIQRRRKEAYILYHTEHIVNAGDEEAIYNCIVREIQREGTDTEDLLNMLLYGIEYELFDAGIMEPANEAVMRIQSKCVLYTDENGHQTIRFIERPSAVSCSLRQGEKEGEPYHCEICYEEYPNSKTRVYLGDCTHSFCFECVQKHATSKPSYSSTIECPFCRTKTVKLEFMNTQYLHTFTQPQPHNNTSTSEYISIMNFL